MSKKNKIEQPELFHKVKKIFLDNKDKISADDSDRVSDLRNSAFDYFKDNGFPTCYLEKWKKTDLSEKLIYDYNLVLDAAEVTDDREKVFKCEVENFDTYLFTQFNGFFVANDAPLTKLNNGVIVGSINAARKELPELFELHYGRYADYSNNGLVALNTALTVDGIFIYVPDNVEVDKAIQMVSITSSNEHVMIQNRNLVILGKNSKLNLVHCDDSTNHEVNFTNTVTEVFLDTGAKLDLIKLQNINNNSTLINSLFVHQYADSDISTNSITLNGGLIRNETHVKMLGRGANSDVKGLFLVDRDQHVDNQVFIDHAVPNCTSNQLFKGIADDSAVAVFNGHVLVRKDAQQTVALQSNKNIALTDKATIYTQPFLEIYADDVKCSHGATVGQLNEEAMFYIKSRGIGELDARLLLMYAFTADVIEKIKIEALRERMDNLVKKRLRGELSVCDQCVLHCSNIEKPVCFNIDMSKINA